MKIVKSAVDAGADILELGMAFSDPIADGRTIQKADIRALNAGVTTEKALAFIKKVKQYKDIPIGLLMYYNLVYHYGTEQFFKDAKDAGVNSVLIADLSIDDAKEITGYAEKVNMDTVFMVTPNTEQQRMKQIISKTTGFIYAVSVLGVTGSRGKVSLSVKGLLEKIGKISDIPVCVGFGISSPAQAKQIASDGANGVIIGSKIIKFIEDNIGNEKKMVAEISAFIKDVKKVL